MHRSNRPSKCHNTKLRWKNREVTVYRPVTTSREVEVPTVSYQNVVENRTVNKDMGRWVTNYHPVAKCAPCQVDPRPGVMGWMNRTGYSMRTAFVPNYTTSRQYVPSMMTCNVPTVRQVAVQGTRRVTVQETKMVAERKTAAGRRSETGHAKRGSHGDAAADGLSHCTNRIVDGLRRISRQLTDGLRLSDS